MFTYRVICGSGYWYPHYGCDYYNNQHNVAPHEFYWFKITYNNWDVIVSDKLDAQIKYNSVE